MKSGRGVEVEQATGEHEIKYVFPAYQALKLATWLKSRCGLDPEYAEGRIASIYFDTRDWSLLGEKINSDFLKTKVRLRWYADPATGRCLPANFLEVKSKVGSSRKKVRMASGMATNLIAAMPLSDEAFLGISLQLQRLGIRLQGTLHPTLRIEYTRLRFIDPLSGARLCVDYDIRTVDCNPRMLARRRPYPLKSGVFELKGRIDQLPDWLHQLTAFGCRRAAFSKYSACWQQVTNQQL
jgi:hypothetical protein